MRWLTIVVVAVVAVMSVVWRRRWLLDGGWMTMRMALVVTRCEPMRMYGSGWVGGGAENGSASKRR